MKFKSLEFKKEQKLAKKNKNEFYGKELSKQIKIETSNKIYELLKRNDKVMIQVQEKALPDFIDILDELSKLYDYSQVDKTKFIFSNKEIKI